MKDYRVTFTAQKQAELVAHEIDLTPAPGELVGENVYSLISTGSERGGYTQKFPDEAYPMETGSSSIARVLAVGEGVHGWKVGDLFYHSGHHTRFVRENAAEALHVPEGEHPAKVLFGRYAAVSMTSIFHMKAKAVDNVIVTGLGMVGSMCASVLQVFGYNVYAVDLSEERREAAREMGLLHVGADLAEAGAPLRADGPIDSAGGLLNGCAAIMECSGNENALHAALPYLRYGADVFQVGVPWHKTSEWDAHDLLYQIFYGYLNVHGGWEWDSIPRKDDKFHAHSAASHVQTAMQLIADGRIRIPERMYELRNPADCQQIYQEITVPRMRPTSMILDWSLFQE